MRIITLAEAIEQGSTASELRVLANCLERIANRGYRHTDIEDTTIEILPYSAEDCRRNASALRRLAREVQRAR